MTTVEQPMPAPVLRLVNEDGSYGRVLAGWTGLEVGGDLGEHLVISVDYQTDHPTYPLLGDGATVAVLVNGEEIPDGRFLIDELTDEEVIPTDVVPRAGNSLLFQLNYALVYPESWTLGVGNVTTPGHGFANQTPGQALRELLELAQGRGWWPELEWDFTDGFDSSGAAWQPNVSEFIDQGTTLLDVVTKWKTRKLAVARMNGGTLQLFTYDTSGPDLSLDVQLFRDVDLTEGPVQRSSRNTVSVILGVTDAQEGPGFGVERTNNPTLSRYGRREGFVSQSQVPDVGTLTSIVDGTLALKARQREAFTYGLTCSHPQRLPFVHYDRGAQVTLRVAGEDRVMRVRQLSVAWDKNGAATGSAAFGDRKMDTEEQLAQRLEQLGGGSMDGGAFGPPIAGSPITNAPDPGGGDTSPDTMPPAPVTGLGVSSAAVFDQGYLMAVSTVTWTAPTTNQDGSDLQDLGAYQVQYRMGTSGNWQEAGRTDKDTTQIVIPRLNVSTQHQTRVRAFDIWGNASSWVQATFTTTNDVIAPAAQPSAPAVATFLFGGLMVTWDGRAQGGGAIDNDIRHVEVHVSTTNNFAPSAGTLKDTIDIGGGSTVIGELTPGTTYYVKFRSVDWAGNIGPVSAQTTGVPDSVQSGDIANGAVTDLKVAGVSATKITTGTLSAVVTLSGEFRTAASGQRVVVNASGVKLYDSAGNVRVNLDATTGEGTFNGVLGAMSLTGYIEVSNGTSRVIMQNFGTIPAVALTSGQLIEKYPSYMYLSTNAFNRELSVLWNAPGSQYQGAGAGIYDYSQFMVTTYPYDGDFANGTTLPTKMTGAFRLRLPYGYVGNTGMNPTMWWLSNYTSESDGVQPHLGPAIVMQDGSNPQRTIGLRVDALAGSTADNVQLTLCMASGSLYADMRLRKLTYNQTVQAPSARATKEDITPVPYSALGVVLENPARRWKYRDDVGAHPSYRLGPMADGLPPEIASVQPDGLLGLDTGSMIGLLWRAIEELADRVDRKEAA